MKKVILFILFCINLFSIEFDFVDYFIIENSYKESPSGETFEVGLDNLIKYSNDRYLAILWKEETIPYKDPQTISDVEKQKKDGKILIDVNKELKIKRELYLAFLKNNGKILMESQSTESSGFSRNLKPFCLESEKLCPYGFINTSNNKIYCFNYSLKLISEVDIPLEKVYDYCIDFDGKNYRLWVFGKKENSNTIAYIYEIKNQKWKDIPINLNNIYSELIRKAKNPYNEKVKFSKKIYKIYSLKDDFSDLGAEIVLSIDENNSEKENYFSRIRHFFKLSISTDGNIILEQVNLWLEFLDIKDIKWDEKKSILLLPSYYKEKNAGFVSLSEKSFLFFLNCAVSFPDNEGRHNEEILDVYSFFFYFQSPSAIPDYFDDFLKIREKIYKETKQKEKLWALQIFWYLEKNKFLFLSPCKGDKETCYAIVEVE